MKKLAGRGVRSLRPAFFSNSASNSAHGLDSRSLETNGLIANMVEYPAVARGRARFRFQVMATHTPEQNDAAARIFRRSLSEARAHLAE